MSGLDHDQVRDRLADGDWDADIETHLEQCPECAEWADRLTTVLDIAPTLYSEEAASSSMADGVLTQTRRASRARYGWVAAAAAIALVVAGGAVFASRQSQADDRVAEAAGELAARGEFRFVAEASATVAIPVSLQTPIDPSDIDLAPLGRCATNTETPVAPDRGDLADALGTLILEDPCTGLDLAGTELDPAVRSAADQLAAASSGWQQLTGLTIDGLPADVEATSRELVRLEADRQVDEINDRVTELEQSARRAAASTSDLAEAESTGEPSDQLRPTALNDLQALSQITQLPRVNLPADAVNWSVLTTGTWDPQKPTASGTADANYAGNALTTVEVPDAEQDPVGAIDALFSDPDTLFALLDSAPNTSERETTWTVPAGLIDTPGVERWVATVVLSTSGSIDTISLVGSNTSETVEVTLLITVER